MYRNYHSPHQYHWTVDGFVCITYFVFTYLRASAIMQCSKLWTVTFVTGQMLHPSFLMIVRASYIFFELIFHRALTLTLCVHIYLQGKYILYVWLLSYEGTWGTNDVCPLLKQSNIMRVERLDTKKENQRQLIPQ